MLIRRGLKHSAENAAIQLLNDMNLLGEDYVDVHQILSRLAINNKQVKIYTGYLEGLKGYTFHHNGNFMVCYDPDGFHEHNVRFTLAHEIGHIYLGHFKENNIDSRDIYGRCEYEANYFAAALLMPEHLLYNFNTLAQDVIADRLRVSQESLGYRINTLHDLNRNTGIHISFCPTCGRLIHGKGARFCAHCGIKISA